MIMEQNISTSTHNKSVNYDELVALRKNIEQDISKQEMRIVTIIRNMATPHGLFKNIAEFAQKKAILQPSFLSTMSNGWQWIKLAIRLIKRFI